MNKSTIQIPKLYQELEVSLTSGQWKSADAQTRQIMHYIVGVYHNNYLHESDLAAFPCEELLWLDWLWLQHSDRRFGFSIQRQIWRQVGGDAEDANYETWLRFGKAVGWRNDTWLRPEQINYTSHACAGHLPIDWLEEWELGDICVTLFARLDCCKNS
jgi:hypothetical protein